VRLALRRELDPQMPAFSAIEQHHSPEGVAAKLGLSTPTIRRLERLGLIRGVRLAGRLRFTESAVREYLDNCASAPRRTPPPELLEAGGRPRGRRRR